MALAPGTTIGHYEITGSLGAGGMGEVYRAHDNKLGREVALKLLPAALASDPATIERFKREELLEQSVHGFYAYLYLSEFCRFLDPVRETPRFRAYLATAKQNAEMFSQRKAALKG